MDIILNSIPKKNVSLGKKMNALVLQEKGKALDYKKVDTPVATESEGIVAVKAAALNHRDVWITKGLYPGIAYPIILGSDGCGIYEGQEVILNPNINWGETEAYQSAQYHILGLPTNGTFAEYVKVGKDKIHPKPAHLTMEEAAALPLSGLTAYRALFTKCQLKVGEKVLISGVGGGVALFACQFAIAAGAEVYVSSSDNDKIAKAVSMGAVAGGNYRMADWTKALVAKAGGFDVVIDSAGGDGFKDLVKMCNPGGRIAFYGGTRGKITDLNPQIIFWKQLSLYGTTMGSDHEFSEMLAFVEQHKIVPVVDTVYKLSEGNAAFEKMDRGLQFGKLVLSIGD